MVGTVDHQHMHQEDLPQSRVGTRRSHHAGRGGRSTFPKMTYSPMEPQLQSPMAYESKLCHCTTRRENGMKAGRFIDKIHRFQSAAYMESKFMQGPYMSHYVCELPTCLSHQMMRVYAASSLHCGPPESCTENVLLERDSFMQICSRATFYTLIIYVSQLRSRRQTLCGEDYLQIYQVFLL